MRRRIHVALLAIVMVLGFTMPLYVLAVSNLNPDDVDDLVARIESIDFGKDVTFTPLNQFGRAAYNIDDFLQFDTVEEFEMFVRELIEIYNEMGSEIGYGEVYFYEAVVAPDSFALCPTHTFHFTESWLAPFSFPSLNPSNLLSWRHINYTIDTSCAGNVFRGGQVQNSRIIGGPLFTSWTHIRGDVQFIRHPGRAHRIPGEVMLTVHGFYTVGIAIEGVPGSFELWDMTWNRHAFYNLH
jgi:hypothetical protein